MDLERRRAVAEHARALLSDVEQHVVDSWDDLLPHTRSWEPVRVASARSAARTVLEGVIGVIEHGDLDDRAWAHARDAVVAHGRLTLDEAGEVLRSVRVAGIALLLDQLAQQLDLDTDERWHLQSRADAFCDDLFTERPDPDPAALDRLLADLESDGPDMG